MESDAGTYNPTVLLVDDDHAAIELMTMMLEMRGHKVLAAYSSAQAIDLIEDMVRQASRWQPLPIDVILLDIMMPGADGFKVCERVKRDPVLMHIPVIMVTALNSSGEKVAAVESGADGYITKPFLPEELRAAVKAKYQIKQREEVLLRRNRELEAANAVSAAASSTLDAEQVLRASLTALMEHADVSAAAIYAVDGSGTGFRRVAQQGVDRPEIRPTQEGPLGRIVRIQESGSQPGSSGKASLPLDVSGQEFRAFVAVPLQSGGRMLGVLEVYHRQWPGFEERDVGLLNEIGERIGAALQNAELFQRLQAWAPQSQGPIADGSEESSKPV